MYHLISMQSTLGFRASELVQIKTLKPHENEDTVHTCTLTDRCDGYSRMAVSVKQGVITSHTVSDIDQTIPVCFSVFVSAFSWVSWTGWRNHSRTGFTRCRCDGSEFRGAAVTVILWEERASSKSSSGWGTHRYNSFTEINKQCTDLRKVTFNNTWLIINCQFVTLFFYIK